MRDSIAMFLMKCRGTRFDVPFRRGFSLYGIQERIRPYIILIKTEI